MMTATGIVKRMIGVADRIGVPLTAGIRSGAGRGLRINLLNATREHAQGTCEPPVQRCLGEYLGTGDVFLDIGANIGFFSIIAARLVGPGGRVLAIEPVPENARCIRANALINRLGNVEVIEAAAGAGRGRGRLLVAAHSGGATLSEDDAPPDLVDTLDVPVLVVDELVDEGRIPVPTLVKIDVEGTEPAVVDGIAGTLVRHRPVVVFEVDDADPRRAECKYQALATRIGGLGYRVDRLERSYAGIPWAVIHGVALPAPTARSPTARSGGRRQA